METLEIIQQDLNEILVPLAFQADMLTLCASVLVIANIWAIIKLRRLDEEMFTTFHDINVLQNQVEHLMKKTSNQP